MRVVVDNQVVQNHAGTPAEIVELTKLAAQEKGRWIVEVRLDGAVWSGELEELKACAANSVEELAIWTQSPNDLMRDVLRQAAEELERADRLQRAAGADLQAGNIVSAMTQLGEAMSIWQTVQKGIELGANTGMIHLEGAVGDAVERLRRQLETLRNTVESRDTSALADELLYDMPGVVQEWRSLLCELEGSIQTHA